MASKISDFEQLKIGIIGAGTMGRGIAQRFAQYGANVVLFDISEKILQDSVKKIERNVKYTAFMNKNINTRKIMEKINTSEDLNNCRSIPLIIENVSEDISIKKKVYTKLGKVCAKNAVIMADTSCIPITKLGGFYGDPENVIGVHFMNPVPLKNFAEVIRGWKTSEDCIDTVKKVLTHINIECEIINDSAGFVSNRLSHLFMNEAAFLVYEGVGDAKQIDNIMKKGFGYKMGPLETADLIGLDTVLDSLEVLYKEYEDPKFRACPLLRRLIEVGETGRKAGKGFYKY